MQVLHVVVLCANPLFVRERPTPTLTGSERTVNGEWGCECEPSWWHSLSHHFLSHAHTTYMHHKEKDSGLHGQVLPVVGWLLDEKCSSLPSSFLSINVKDPRNLTRLITHKYFSRAASRCQLLGVEAANSNSKL